MVRIKNFRAALLIFLLLGFSKSQATVQCSALLSTPILRTVKDDFKGLGLIKYVSSKLLYRSGLHTIKTVSGEDVVAMIDGPTRNNLKKIEIGAANHPLCKDCIQVDNRSSIFDMHRDNIELAYVESKLKSPENKKSRIELGKEAGLLSERELAPWHVEVFGRPLPDLLDPFAVASAEEGLLADARDIPLPSGSSDLIITKNFPWFQRLSPIERVKSLYPESGLVFREIREVLTEYNRLLAPGGRVLILINGEGLPYETMWNHISVASQIGLGYSFVEPNTLEVQGVLLEKPGLKD